MAINGVIQGLRYTGSVNTALYRPDWEAAMMYVEPYQRPFMSWLFFSKEASSAVVTDVTSKFQWAEDEYQPYQTTLAADFAGGATTGSITVATGTGEYFRVGNIVLLETSDTAAYITGITNDTISIASLDGTTNLGTGTSGDFVKVIGDFTAEAGGIPTALSTNPANQFNYCTILVDGVNTTGRMQAGQFWTTGNTHKEQVEKKIKDLAWRAERLFLLSPTAGTSSISATVNGVSVTVPVSWGKGVLGFVQTNKIPYTGAMTEQGWDNFLYTIFTGKGGSNRRDIYLGGQALNELGSFIKNKYQVRDIPTTEYGIDMKEYITNYGMARLIWDPALDGKYTKYALAIDPGHTKLRYMGPDDKGPRRFRIEENVEVPGTDVKTDKLLMDVGLQMTNEEVHGIYYRSA